MIVDNGKGGEYLPRILGAWRLQDVFAPANWRGRESEAMMLYEEMKPAMPEYYRQEYARIDMAAIREHAMDSASQSSAVERFKRKQKSDILIGSRT